MPSRYDKYATHHTSRRTDGWEYTQPAAYFVTICTDGRVCLFGQVERGCMWLNALGRIVAEEWKRSEEIRDRVHLDAFVVMPNHVHGIVVFAEPDVDAPTCPRGYRVFGVDSDSEWTGGMDDPSDSKRANDDTVSHGGAEEKPNPSNSRKASTGRSTLGGDAADRPTGPAPRSLGSFVAGFKSAAIPPDGTPIACVIRQKHDAIAGPIGRPPRASDIQTASTHRMDNSTDEPNSMNASHRRATRAETGEEGTSEFHRPSRSLGAFGAGFKSVATARMNRHRDTPGALMFAGIRPTEAGIGCIEINQRMHTNHNHHE